MPPSPAALPHRLSSSSADFESFKVAQRMIIVDFDVTDDIRILQAGRPRVYASSGWRGGLKPLGTLHGHVSTHLSIRGGS